jgi:hypothetical protein
MSGKGSNPRPFQVANEEYAMRWNLIFGRDNEKENKKEALESDRPDNSCDSRVSDNPQGQAGQTKTP